MRRSRTVHLVDASPYVFRAWFALPDSLVTPDGAPANAVYGFAGFLLRLLAEEQPTHVAVAFDESLTTSFRNDIYPAYKAQRGLPPAELEAQLANCRELARALGLAAFADERYEADDILATLARRLVKDGHGAVVVTSDKDLAQLVSDRVQLFDFAKGDRYGPDEVRAKFGVPPDLVADWLGLAGDAVDNIPGVPGVGAKTAVALLAQYPGLDAVYADLEGVAGLPLRGAKSLAKKLEQHRELAFLSKQLATVAYDAPVDAELADLEWNGADAERLDALFERVGFDTLRDRVPKWKGGPRASEARPSTS